MDVLSRIFTWLSEHEAGISAVVFGFAHMYSLVGFLEVTWTGFILAIGYERCHSLWPCIVAHAYNNLFFVLLMWVFYRG